MDHSKVLKGLAIWAIVAAALLILLPGMAAMFLLGKFSNSILNSESPTAQETPQGELGGEGSTCGGGTLRLPCNPGLKCSADLNSATTGVCQKASQNSAYNFDLPEGSSCGFIPDSCAGGLFCKYDPLSESSKGQCEKATNTSPQIVQYKISGAELSSGAYSAKVGTKLNLSAKTLNANSVSAYFVFNDQSKEALEIKMKRGTGGQYTSEKTFTVEKGMDGKFEFQAEKDGDYSSAVSAFAASE